MYGSVDATTPEERGVRGIDDAVDVEFSNVPEHST
jgi:hypothetical protein